MGIADTAGLSGGSAGQSWMCNAAGGPRSQLGLGFQVGIGGEPGTSGFRLIRDPPQDYVALGGGFYAGSTAPRSFTAYANSGKPAVAASGNENSGFELMRRPPRWNHMGGQEDLFAQNEDHNNSNRSLMTLSVRQRRRRGGVASNPCQDCGNQAKKDCSYQRCRTCCKSRGFQCSTHLRSTWIPAAQRRERQQVGGSSSSAPRSKRARILALAAAQSHNNTTSNSSDGTSPPPSPIHHNTSTLLLTYGQQEVNSVGSSFPPEVRAAAVFKCLKISASDDAKGEYAYKATVKIGDHVFKGVLYDQGGYSSPTENQRKRSNTGDESGSFWNDDLNSNNNRIAMAGQGGGVDQVVARDRMASGLGSLMDHHVTTTTAGGGADPQRWFACGE